MNFKRCAVRNELKTSIIKTLAKGLNIEQLSSLIDTRMEGIGFLDDVTNKLEKEIEKEYQGRLRYDTTSLEKIMDIVHEYADESMIKESASNILMDYIRKGDASLKEGASMKWVNARGEVEAAYQAHNVYQLQDELENITLEAFIYSIVEEAEASIAARKAFTNACKKEGLTKENYPGWYEEIE